MLSLEKSLSQVTDQKVRNLMKDGIDLSYQNIVCKREQYRNREDRFFISIRDKSIFYRLEENEIYPFINRVIEGHSIVEIKNDSSYKSISKKSNIKEILTDEKVLRITSDDTNQYFYRYTFNKNKLIVEKMIYYGNDKNISNGDINTIRISILESISDSPIENILKDLIIYDTLINKISKDIARIIMSFTIE